MKLSVFLVLGLLSLSSVSIQDIEKKSSQFRKGRGYIIVITGFSSTGDTPELDLLKLSSFYSFYAEQFLCWVGRSGGQTEVSHHRRQVSPESSRPGEARPTLPLISLVTTWTLSGGFPALRGRRYLQQLRPMHDDIRKYHCEAGLYKPSLGRDCRYPCGNREYYAPKFLILPIKENLALPLWLGGSCRSAHLPQWRNPIDDHHRDLQQRSNWRSSGCGRPAWACGWRWTLSIRLAAINVVAMCCNNKMKSKEHVVMCGEWSNLFCVHNILRMYERNPSFYHLMFYLKSIFSFFKTVGQCMLF